MARRGPIIGWLLAMLVLPPLAAFLFAIAGSGSNAAAQGALIVYGALMLGLGIGAAMSVAKGPARIGFALLFIVGMAVAQCAVFFVGCSIMVGLS